jgi:peptide/nickel transport system substrate-binding protein
MAVIRTRLWFWLVKAYIKRWGKLMALFFFLGLCIFFLLLYYYPLIIRVIPFERKTVIGLTGAYTVDNIPEIIQNKISRGLTRVDNDASIKPDLALKWEILDKGKTYIFHLKKNIEFSNGTPFIADNIQYSFSDVKVTHPDSYTIEFRLKNPYAPFLVTVSKPIFYKSYIGIGDYIINNIELNGNFIKSIQLTSRNNKYKTLAYIFYSSTEALKISFALGEITSATGLSQTDIQTPNILSSPNFLLDKVTDYRHLVTLFYNTEDSLLSDKKIRDGLSYALPDDFLQGVRVRNPYPPLFSYYDSLNVEERKQDPSHAKLLISSALDTAGVSTKPVLTIKTLSKYFDVAKIVSKSFENIGLKVKIEIVESIPRTFQIYLGDFNVPKDPDQYTLWHSSQSNNITRLKNLRIDKLLEDGRETIDIKERLKIYIDLQKYLLDESPASFLYFPYEYTISRK